MTTSAHKLLNVLYDSALVTCRHPRMIEDALSMRTVYAVDSREREPNHFTLEGSRRAPGADIWAVPKGPRLRGLGAHIETCCANARRFAEALAGGGIRIVNDVVFNQVLFDLGQAEGLDRILSLIQAEGTSWVGPTVWRGAPAWASFCRMVDDARGCRTIGGGHPPSSERRRIGSFVTVPVWLDIAP